MKPIRKPSIAGRLGIGARAAIKLAAVALLGIRLLGIPPLGMPLLGMSLLGTLLLGTPLAHAGAPVEQASIAERTAADEVRSRIRTAHASQAPASADSTTSLASRLIGTWKLIAIRDRDPATGKETPAARAADDGQLVYSPNGRLSVQIARKGRESAPKGSADGFSSYFGRWELLPAEGCVIHHQDGNLNYAQTGQAAKRYYSFDAEGHLSLATPPAKRDDGHTTSTVFVWEKIP